jgi:hypothetical protein
MNCIKYIFIGNIDKKVIVGTYPFKKDKEIQNYHKKAKAIFDSIILTNEINGSIQQKKIIDKEICYFTIKNNDIFYLIITSKSTDENLAFAFIDEVENNNIYLLINDKTNTLNDVGKNELKKIFNEFNKNPLIFSNRSSNSKVDIIESELKENKKNENNDIKDISVNVEDLNKIESKTVDIENTSYIFKSNNENISFQNLWNNKRFKIIFVGIIIFIVIILLIYVASKSEK